MGIKEQIDYIINEILNQKPINSIKNQLKNINIIINNAIGEIKKNNEKLCLFKNNITSLLKKCNFKEKERKISPEQAESWFRFSNDIINIEKEFTNEDKNVIIKLENIKIKQIFRPKLISWLKEDNSNKEINFEQENINKELPFSNIDKFLTQQDDLNLNLIVDNPQDKTDYKMFISIINKENNKKISEKPIEIAVKLKKHLPKERNSK